MYGYGWGPPPYGGYPPNSPVSFIQVPRDKEDTVFKLLDKIDKRERRKKREEEEKNKNKDKDKKSDDKKTGQFLMFAFQQTMILCTFGLPVGIAWWFMIVRPALTALGFNMR